MPDHTAPQVQPVGQRLRAWRAGQLLLGTCRAHLYFPDDRHPLWAVPARTTCQYKGEASYFRVQDSDAELRTYRHPGPEAAAIAGHLTTAGQPGVQITVDGVPEGQP
jgi:uncharacterized protein (DUF427 family)